MGLMIHLGLALLCITASAAAPPPSSSPCCPSLAPLSQDITFPIDDNTRNLTLFNQSSLSLSPTGQPFSSSFTFTSDFSDSTPSLAFILVPSLPPPQGLPQAPPLMQSELSFDFTIQSCPNSSQLLTLDFCTAPLQIEPEVPYYSCSASAGSFDSFEYAVSLTHDADAAEVQVQAVSHLRAGKINQTFTFSTLPYGELARGRPDDHITLLVGYITQGGTNIHMTANVDTMSSPSSPIYVVCPAPQQENNFKSNHTKVVVWVLVVVSMVVFLIGLFVLALFLKRYRARLSSSHSAGHVAPSSTITRAPFPPPHHLESGATPMMRWFPLSPAHDTNNFQMSGTATWLKQPNAR